MPLSARPLAGLARQGSALPTGYGSRRFQMGIGKLYENQLTAACEIFLKGLIRAPDDELLERGFQAGTDKWKHWHPARWSKWPFADPDAEEYSGPQPTEPPGLLPPTTLSHVTINSVELEWPAYEPRPGVLADVIDGYYLEVSHLCPIEGPGPWLRAYKGTKRSHTVKGLTIAKDILVRVRAYNRRGGGEWSEERRYRVLAPPPPKLVEHRQVPGAWRLIDIEDVIKDNNLVEGSNMMEQVVQGLFEQLHAFRTPLKLAFRYYALIGASSSRDDDADSMSMQQFLLFSRAMRLLDDPAHGSSATGKIILSDIDRIFVRSSRDVDGKGASPAFAALAAAPAADEGLADEGGGGGSGGGAEKEWAKARNTVKAVGALKAPPKAKGNKLLQHHFIGGVIRLACLRYAAMPHLPNRLRAFCQELLEPHVHDELELLHDAFSKLMQLQPYTGVYNRRRALVEPVFRYYAGVDITLGNEKKLATMNVRELSELCDDAHLFDGKFGVREMVMAFVRVNIEDDIYIQADKQNTSTELVLDEFFEVLARMHYAREGLMYAGGGDGDQGQEALAARAARAVHSRDGRGAYARAQLRCLACRVVRTAAMDAIKQRKVARR